MLRTDFTFEINNKLNPRDNPRVHPYILNLNLNLELILTINPDPKDPYSNFLSLRDIIGESFSLFLTDCFFKNTSYITKTKVGEFFP